MQPFFFFKYTSEKRFQTIPIDTGQSHQLNQHLVHDLTSAIDHLDWVIL